MDLFIARQPIFDKERALFAYELLFRDGPENYFHHADSLEATSNLISESILSFGLEMLSSGHRLFINASREVILEESFTLLPSDKCVVEVVEDVGPDEEVLAACRRLKEKGYVIALDDFAFQPEKHLLIDLADIIKIDIKTIGLSLQRKMVARFRHDKILIAEKVETEEDFIQARDAGYDYFQGYFFSRPVMISKKEVPGIKIQYLLLMEEILKPELELGELEAVIKRDVSLAFKLLNYINSPVFGLLHAIKSIRHALVVLGEREVRKWACLMAMGRIGEDQPHELVVTALFRARFCETLAPLIGNRKQSQDFFLMGMFSLVDTIVGRPIEEILMTFPLAEEIKSALLGGKNLYSDVLDLVRAYERGDWKGLDKSIGRLGLEEKVLPEIYLAALEWAGHGLRM